MMFFLKMQGERVWNLIEYGWGLPLILDTQGRSIGELKPKKEWDKADNECSEANTRALFNICNGVCPYRFCRIANCKHENEAWDILQVTCESTSSVKISKLQMLVTRFENIRTHENQTFSSFYFELSDIVNSSFKLRELIPNSKVVRKILRSFLEKFRPKVTTIGESKDIDFVSWWTCRLHSN